MKIGLVVVGLALAGTGGTITGGLLGLPSWLTSLILQLPFVALFFWMYSRERKERIATTKQLVTYLEKAPDKIMDFTNSQRDGWSALERKCDAVLELAAKE